MPAPDKFRILLLLSIWLYVLPVTAQENTSENVLDKSKVCMVDDEYKGEQQLTTTINEKVYFGCCEPCIELLLADTSFRYATDPFSGSKVCKADAFIVRKSGEDSKVLYFESEESFRNFSSSRK